MVQNFLQLTFKNQTTGVVIEVITFTTDEIPNGIIRNVPLRVNEFATTGGRARTFPQPDGIRFEFSVVVAEAITIQKLDYIAAHVGNGRIVDVQALIGSMVYSVTTTNLAYNAAIGAISNGVISSFDVTYRQMVGSGQRSRNEVAMVIKEGGTTALPLAANYVGN